jgi:hypothetical protein
MIEPAEIKSNERVSIPPLTDYILFESTGNEYIHWHLYGEQQIGISRDTHRFSVSSAWEVCS